MKRYWFMFGLIIVLLGGGIAGIVLGTSHYHSYEHHEAKAPTCEVGGNNEYYYCEECGKYYDADKKEIAKEDVFLDALGHIYQFDSFEWEADYSTCKVNLVCANDANHKKQQDLDVVVNQTPANCASVSETTYSVSYGEHTDEKVVYGEEKVAPKFSAQSGFYDEAFDLTISTDIQCDIYYTLDSSKPTKDSTKYTGVINIDDNSSQPNVITAFQDISALNVYFPNGLVDKCVNIRAIAIDEFGNESEVIERNYFVGYDQKEGYSNLPIVSLSMEYGDLFDYERGIYTTGKIYDEADPSAYAYPEQIPANYNEKGKEWERLAYMTYYDAEKNYSFSQSIGVRIHGGWSRSFNQKSFNLYARKEYSGSNSFEKPFFGGDELKTCMLRSGGYRDTYITKVRDSLNQDFSEDELFDVQRGYPCIVFLNGEYWGIYNLQERYSDDYVNEHYGIKKKNVIIVKNDEIDEGEEEDIALYENLRTFFTENTFETSEKYELAKNYIDVNEFAAYMAMQLYVGNIDWPGNNVRMWRSRTIGDNPKEDGRWHFMIYDTDDCAAIHTKCKVSQDPFQNLGHWKWGPLDERSILGLMLSKLIANESFKTLFRQTMTRMGTEVFTSEKVNEYLDAKILLLQDNMEKFYWRFDKDQKTKQNFLDQIQVIKDYFAQRYSYMITFMETNIV